VKAGAARARQRRLGSAAVVGVTCCSASLPAMDGIAFDVAVLDEASQLVEPLSMLPLARAGCRRASQAARAPPCMPAIAYGSSAVCLWHTPAYTCKAPARLELHRW